MEQDRASGRFLPGVSGNPAGRPRKAKPASPLDAALGAATAGMSERMAATVALVAAGKRAPAPSSPWVPGGESGWQRFLRNLPDAELQALGELPREDLEALAAALGGSLAEATP